MLIAKLETRYLSIWLKCVNIIGMMILQAHEGRNTKRETQMKIALFPRIATTQLRSHVRTHVRTYVSTFVRTYLCGFPDREFKSKHSFSKMFSMKNVPCPSRFFYVLEVYIRMQS